MPQLNTLTVFTFTLIVTVPFTYAEVESGGDLINYKEIHHPVVGKGGMVVAQDTQAAKIGTFILQKGGNAVDAAVAVGFALAVTLPQAGNIGGGGFMLVYMANTKQTTAIDYYGEIPSKLISQDTHYKIAHQFSYQTVAIPGTVAGLWTAHQQFGKLPWKMLIEPAIQLAQNGIIITYDGAQVLQRRRAVLSKNSEAKRIFFKSNGQSYQAGEIFKQPDLAWSLIQIRDQGADAFYRGLLAKRFIQGIQQHKGLLSLEDLAQYKVKLQAPIWFNYRGYHIASTPPPSGGVVLASIMNLLEQFSIRTLGSNTASSLHLIAEVLKLGHYDFNWVGGFPWHTPTQGITSKTYAKKRAQSICSNKVMSNKQVIPKTPISYEDTDTTHYSIADKEGNLVSNTYTLSSSFGAHVVAPNTGILLNNSLRNLRKPKSNIIRQKSQALAPYKRISSTITPIIVFRKNRPWLVSGTLGGTHIMGIMAQLLVNVIDHHMNLAEATMTPRIHQLHAHTPLKLEYGISEDISMLLKTKGHVVQRSYTMGSTQSILIKNDYCYGAADTRRPNAIAISANC